MTYAILCFTSENLANSTWSQDQDDEIMDRLTKVQQEFNGQVISSARLLPTSSAVSVRRGRLSDALVIDGPFIESKEQFLGYYLVDCKGLDDAIGFAQQLIAANPWSSGYEIRPLRSNPAAT